MHESEYQRLKNAAQAMVDLLPKPEHEFSLNIGWAKDYDELFRNRMSATAEDSILDQARLSGRVLLSGKGGSGKTHLLYRVARKSIERGWLPIFLSLKSWNASDYGRWKEWSQQAGGGAAFLLHRFLNGEVTATSLDLLPPTVHKLLLLDGLNEIAAPLGQDILWEVDKLVRDQMQMSAVVTDRLTRRELPSPTRWSLGVVRPLDAAVIGQFTDGSKFDLQTVLLSSPFFLDVALQEKKPTRIADFIAKKAGLSALELGLLAKMAFEAYEKSKSRTFAIDDFSFVPEAVIKRLNDANILSLTNEGAQFSHHLIHDYLAAVHVSLLKESDWTGQTLNVISFDSSSFDAVAFVFLELDQSRSEQFLRSVYDWNLYAAGYIVSEAARYGRMPSEEMLVVILAMLAEKRFDLVVASSQRAADALLVSEVGSAAAYSAAESIEGIKGIVASHDFAAQWFKQWRDAFILSKDAEVDEEQFKCLFSTDSIKGWTLANVLKRTKLSEQRQIVLKRELPKSGEALRWRIVHVLGSYPTEENSTTLFEILDRDPEVNVRYGAVRSLAELAFHAEERLRENITANLVKRTDALSRDPKVRDELTKALIIDPRRAPKGWLTVVLQIAREFFMREEKIEERDRWRSYAAKAEAYYS